MHPQTWFWKFESLWEQSCVEFPHPEISHKLSGIRNHYNSEGESQYFRGLFLRETISPQGGNQVVFTDELGNGFSGLAELHVAFDRFGRPIYLFDNHQLALYAFSEIAAQTQKPLTVMHLDAHRDDAKFPSSVPLLNLSNVAEIISKCRVSDYLDVAMRGGLVKNIISLTDSRGFEQCTIPSEAFLLNLDLDIFGEEGSAIDFARKLRVLRMLWDRASAIILATSPGFIEQSTACRLASVLCSDSF